MTDQEFNAKLTELRDRGFEIERPVKEHDGWTFGQPIIVVTDDCEDEGVYEGDEGLLILEEVGAPQYGNVRVSYAIAMPGYDGQMDVASYAIEPA